MPNYDTNNRMIRLAIGAITVVTATLPIAGIGALDGIVTSYVINYISSFSPFIAGLSPFVIGGIIGVGLLIPIFGIHDLVKGLISGSENFSKDTVKNIVEIGVVFVMGAGLVALGVTSPAAIGALTLLSLMLLNVITPSSTMTVISTDKHQNTSKGVKNDGAVPAF